MLHWKREGRTCPASAQANKMESSFPRTVPPFSLDAPLFFAPKIAIFAGWGYFGVKIRFWLSLPKRWEIKGFVEIGERREGFAPDRLNGVGSN